MACISPRHDDYRRPVICLDFSNTPAPTNNHVTYFTSADWESGPPLQGLSKTAVSSLRHLEALLLKVTPLDFSLGQAAERDSNTSFCSSNININTHHGANMASFLEDLWNSIFTPGPTPTLLVATNASFAALLLLLLILLVATYSIHFLILSVLCAGLWWSINWFTSELLAAKAKEAETHTQGKLPEPDKASIHDSDTETEAPVAATSPAMPRDSSTLLRPRPAGADEAVRRRRSLGDSSGYISTDSEWEKVSEGDGKER